MFPHQQHGDNLHLGWRSICWRPKPFTLAHGLNTTILRKRHPSRHTAPGRFRARAPALTRRKNLLADPIVRLGGHRSSSSGKRSSEGGQLANANRSRGDIRTEHYQRIQSWCKTSCKWPLSISTSSHLQGQCEDAGEDWLRVTESTLEQP